ncbi:hypothetical protein [Serratia sp. 14-2641]|uniref:hypothetical protein n=1 Tax=Serratia sp. 14-2641 TaxID=1841657 RepID=UPI00080F99E1|nr:hypothetical protein [Serratia sp. 14-2641]OCJ30565.1 hypothetical protein A6U95_06590 [Serratia sp. 14-2641]
MFEKFTWNVNSDQVYSQKYGSQFTNMNTINGLDKAVGKTFTMNAGFHQYVVKPSEDITSIYWDESSVIEVLSGRFVLDFSRGKDSSAIIRAQNIKIGGAKDLDASFEIQGCYNFHTDGSISIKSNGTLYINSLQNHFRFGDVHQTVNLENNAKLSISANNTSATTCFVNGPIELNDESYAELKVATLTHDENTIYSLKDSANLWVYADEITSTKQETIFNLHSGKTQISICGFTNEYCDITSLGKGNADTPKARFNFTKKDGKNEGQIILSCSFNMGETETNLGALMFWLAANEMLCIDGNPANISDFNFNFDNDFLVISLNN